MFHQTTVDEHCCATTTLRLVMTSKITAMAILQSAVLTKPNVKVLLSGGLSTIFCKLAATAIETSAI